MNYPALNIGVITYNRPFEIRETLTSLFRNLRYAGRTTLYIADDSSPPEYRSTLSGWLRDNCPWNFHVLTTPHNQGWGANANHLITTAHMTAPYLYFTEDDYVLHKHLDLSPVVALMENEPTIAMMRFRATAGTPLLYQGHETDISNFLPDHREHLGYGIGRIQWLELMVDSPSLWLYSNGPHLKTAAFHFAHDLYPEGLKLGATEESYAHHVIDNMRTKPGMPKIAILPDWFHMEYEHIGHSYQFTEHDKERRP